MFTTACERAEAPSTTNEPESSEQPKSEVPQQRVDPRKDRAPSQPIEVKGVPLDGSKADFIAKYPSAECLNQPEGEWAPSSCGADVTLNDKPARFVAYLGNDSEIIYLELQQQQMNHDAVAQLLAASYGKPTNIEGNRIHWETGNDRMVMLMAMEKDGVVIYCSADWYKARLAESLAEKAKKEDL